LIRYLFVVYDGLIRCVKDQQLQCNVHNASHPIIIIDIYIYRTLSSIKSLAKYRHSYKLCYKKTDIDNTVVNTLHFDTPLFGTLLVSTHLSTHLPKRPAINR